MSMLWYIIIANYFAYCRAVNAETFQTIEHNPVSISILLYTRNPYSYRYSHFEIVICIYSVRGDIDQMSTNTSSYTICSAPNVYIFVYILIETRIAPLNIRIDLQVTLWNLKLEHSSKDISMHSTKSSCHAPLQICVQVMLVTFVLTS